MANKVWQRGLLAGVLGIVTLLSGCGGGSGQTLTKVDNATVINRSGDPVPAILASNVLGENLEAFVDDALQQPDIRNVAVILDAPVRNYRYVQARGVANPQTGEQMTTATPFRIASMSKTLTATIVLQLVEEGFLTLDTPLSAVLDDSILPAGYTLADLHVRGGFKSGERITIRQLLQHTAGLRDYIPGLFASMIDDAVGNNVTGAASRQWQPQALLAYYLESGLGLNAVNEPGARFAYSDTHYLLLGLVIERVTGQSLTSNYRGRIFNRLGMSNSWHEGFENPRGRIAHHFYNLASQGINRNLDVAATSLNTSAAWASGSLVASADDMDTFLQALFRGDLFRDAATLQLMQDVSVQSPYYGLGLQRAIFNGVEVWGHAGFWGSIMLYAPARDARLVMTLNQADREMFREAEKLFVSLLAGGL